MRKSLKLKIGPRILTATLGLGLLTPLALMQIGCTSPAKDKASNQIPAISTVQFADLKTPTAAWPATAANTWTITAGSTTYLEANYGSVGGTAVLSPGNITLVSGTPVALTPTATTTYTVTVTDGSGHTTSQTALLNVIPAPTDVITAPAAVIANQAGQVASVPGAPTNAPGTTYQWTYVNAIITSDPTAPSITFTPGSANTDGSAKNMSLTCVVTAPSSTPAKLTSTVTIPVESPAPTALAYSTPSPIYYLGLPIQTNVPNVTGVVQTYSVSPALPAGLALDPVLGTITGTPTAEADTPSAYTITAANSGGFTTAVVNIAVQAQPSLVFNTPSPAKIGPGGASILSWSAGASVSAISITAVPPDPTLPATFPVGNGSVNNISPTQTTVYTLTATLQGGGTEPPLTQTITVDATPLAFTTPLSATPLLTSFGGTSTFNWALAGTPNTLSLVSPNAAAPQPVTASATSFALSPVVRRQTYTLKAVNGLGTVSSNAVSVAAQGLDVLAGNITKGAGSHDATGTSAQFNLPSYAGVDPAGNLYVPDANNHVIRLVTPQGVVTTLAGTTGVPGTTDNKPGLQAQFNTPRSVVYWQDASNNNQPYLFVVDYANHAVRKVTLSGTTMPITATNVTVFAGIVGSYQTNTTGFDNPINAVIDNKTPPNLLVAENYNGDVVKVSGLSGTTGTINAATVAGARASYGYVDGANASALFDGVSGMAFDPTTGNLYVSENYNNRIRLITPTTTSTIAGDTTQPPTGSTKLVGAVGFVDGGLGTSRVNGPNGLALSGHILYIADTKNNAVRALDLTTNILTTVIGSAATGTATPGTYGNMDGQGNAATLGSPYGLYMDANGTLTISETGNNDLRKADKNFNVTTFAGSAPSVGTADGPLGTGAMAINPAISTNNTMAGMVLDGSGNLFVSDTYNNCIRMVSPNGTLSTIAGTPGLGTAGHADGVGSAASFNQPAGLARDSSGNIYVADQSNSTIRQLTYDTVNKVWNVSTIAGIPLTTGVVNGATGTSTFKYPYGLTVAPDNSLYVTDTGNKVIRHLTNIGGVWTAATVTVTGFTLNTPMGIATDASGNLYVAERYSYYVGRLVGAANTWTGTIIGGFSGTKGYVEGAVTAVKTTSSLFLSPQGVSVDANGNVYVADSLNNTIRKITQVAGVWTTSTVLGQAVTTSPAVTTAVQTGTSTGSFPASLTFPQNVLVSPSGHDLYITTNGGVAQATAIDGQ